MNKEKTLETYNVLAEAGATAIYAWNHHLLNPRFIRNFCLKPTVEGSDAINFIPAETVDRRLLSVTVERHRRRITYDQGLRGVVYNPLRHTATICFISKKGEPHYATYKRTRIYLNFVENDTNNSIEKAA